MWTLRNFTHSLVVLMLMIITVSSALAADPGLAYPATSEVSDQKPGSVLIYNLYTSSAAGSTAQNTRINLTNTSTSSAAFVHLFFVDGATCSVADAFVCLTANQTASFLASDFDPGTSGFIVVIANDGVTGCPASFNFLIGSEYVKLSTGHSAKLNAEAFAALYDGTLPGCDPNSTIAELAFNGVVYNRVPRVLALDNIPSRADGNDTLLILNRIGGNLGLGASSIGALFGILYDDAETAVSFSFTTGTCQLRTSLSSAFPRTTPRFETFIPASRNGWMKIYSLVADIGLLGAAINFNANATTAGTAFTGGANLHKLRLASSAVYTVPVFPPSC
jgi:hypothetical protein